jgi:DNA-nicking Smr family endonuclease
VSKKRDKGKGGGEDAGEALPRAPERISSPFKDALGPLKKQLEHAAKQAEQAKKEAKNKPPPPPRPVTRKAQKQLDDDGLALSLAMQGVKPLAGGVGRVTATTPKVPTRTAQVVPFGRNAEEDARARLDALVAQDVSFRIERERDWVRGARIDAHARVVRELGRRTRASETLDLHGMTQREAREAVLAFIRGCHKRGLTVICVIHGKGQHSDDGLGVLRDVVIDALTNSAIATLVFAFTSAPEALGGSGALLIELKH